MQQDNDPKLHQQSRIRMAEKEKNQQQATAQVKSRPHSVLNTVAGA